MSAKFFFRVKTQYENIGDALINRELITSLSERGGLILDLSSTPSRFKKNITGNQHGISLSRSSLYFYLKMIREVIFGKKNVYYFLNPGGYGGEITRKAAVRMNIICFIVFLLTLIGVKVCRVGVSYSKLGSRHMSITRRMASLLYYHSVRDSVSENYCRNNNIKVGRVVPDLAFNLTVNNGKENKDIDYLFSFRAFNNYSTKNFESNARDFFNQQRLLNIKLAFQVTFDEEYQYKLARLVSPKLNVLDMTESLTDNSNIYGGVKYVVSNRLHVLLLALSAGATPIAIIDFVSNEKILSVFEDAGLGHLVFNASDFSFENVCRAELTSEQRKEVFATKSKQLDTFFNELL